MILKNVEKKENNAATFQVESDAAEFESAVNGAYLKNKASINIPGFRKGKAPRAVVEGMYGTEVFYQDAMDELAPKAFEFGLAESELRMVGAPSIVNVEVTDGRTVEYTFGISLYPEVKLGQYKGLEAERKDEEEMDRILDKIRKSGYQALSDEEKRKAVKDFNFSKGLIVALLAGFMSACFSIGLGFGESLCFEQSADIYRTLPATLMVTLGGFLTNAAYCLWQNRRNSSWSDYRYTSLYANNLLFCSLAGALWYSQFFGLSLGKGFLASSPVLLTFSWCILMSLNVTFSNVWGILLKEWKGCSARTVTVLVIGLLILILSSFLPQLLETT